MTVSRRGLFGALGLLAGGAQVTKAAAPTALDLRVPLLDFESHLLAQSVAAPIVWVSPDCAGYSRARSDIVRGVSRLMTPGAGDAERLRFARLGIAHDPTPADEVLDYPGLPDARP
jgi:hypothetical protein